MLYTDITSTVHLIFQFDPAIQRFASMKVTQYDHFKATPKSGLIGFFVLIVPVTLLTYFANEHHVSALVLVSCITFSTLQQYLKNLVTTHI